MKTIQLKLTTAELEILDKVFGALWKTENHQSPDMVDLMETDSFNELSEKLAEALEDSKR